MTAHDLVLGIDSSTQGTSGVLLSREGGEVVAQAAVRYRDDPRLAGFGLSGDSPLLPATEEGEAHQPAALYLAALEALLEDLPPSLLIRVAAVNLSAQQHGQIWLGAGAPAALAGLTRPGCGRGGEPRLAARLSPSLSWDRAPLWMCAHTAAEAAALRLAAGGTEAMVVLSGSDSPLRFSGAVLAHEARRHPEAWRDTAAVHLISSFLGGVLAGRADCPLDWGNASGMSLMDWKARTWSPLLVAAAERAAGLAPQDLLSRLPALAHPQAEAGVIATYFTERFGLPTACRVLVGSGDNPQSKVLAEGGLLSLGTSFVLMANGEAPHRSANAMYDGLGRPFLFGCRTNGALAWEGVRRLHGVAPEDFAASEAALGTTRPEGEVLIHQPERESFPASEAYGNLGRASFAADYAGTVDSTLGLVYLGALPFSRPGPALSVTGGVTASTQTVSRIASIWNCPVIPLAGAGASIGAALAAAAALGPPEGAEAYLATARTAAAGAGRPVMPDPRLVALYHGEGGYLSRLRRKAEALGMAL